MVVLSFSTCCSKASTRRDAWTKVAHDIFTLRVDPGEPTCDHSLAASAMVPYCVFVHSVLLLACVEAWAAAWIERSQSWRPIGPGSAHGCHTSRR